MDWDDYRYFGFIAHSGSVRGAAEDMGVNASTVARRLDALEGRLGVRLFHRSRSGLELTSEGAAILGEVENVSGELEEVENRLRARATEAARLIRLTLPDFVAQVLIGHFAEFIRTHPALRLEFLPEQRPLDIARREADVAIRITDHPPESLVGRRLGRYRLAVYASRDYLATHDPLTRPDSCLWVESGMEIIRGLGFKGRFYPGMPLGPRCNNILLQLAAVRSGIGVSLLPCVLGDRDPDLQRVGSGAPVDAQDFWLLFHPDLRGVEAVQALSGFLQTGFELLRPELLGERPQS
ncbi:MAG: LysR family transcriptional regulator [Pseudomonadales bacterium]|nr:LysR family transcriptional regulator [Pseudomonadales bacterium]